MGGKAPSYDVSLAGSVVSMAMNRHSPLKGLWVLLVAALLTLTRGALAGAPTPPASASATMSLPEAPVVVFNRTVAVVRAPLFGVVPSERARHAAARLEELFARPGPMKLSVTSTEMANAILVNGSLGMLLTSGDVDALEGETLDHATQIAVTALERVAAETREARGRGEWHCDAVVVRAAHGCAANSRLDGQTLDSALGGQHAWVDRGGRAIAPSGAAFRCFSHAGAWGRHVLDAARGVPLVELRLEPVSVYARVGRRAGRLFGRRCPADWRQRAARLAGSVGGARHLSARARVDRAGAADFRRRRATSLRTELARCGHCQAHAPNFCDDRVGVRHGDGLSVPPRRKQ